jgi:signal transduction histidine kinase
MTSVKNHDEMEDIVKHLLGSIAAKVAAYIVLVLNACLTLSCVIGAVIMTENDFYNTGLGELRAMYYGNATALKLVNIGYALRYWIYIILVFSAIIALLCFVFLMCASGHHTYEEQVSLGWGGKIPFDPLTLCAFVSIWGFGDFVLDMGYYNSYYEYEIVAVFALALAFIFAIVVFTGYCMSFASRIKVGAWHKNTVIYMLLRVLYHALKGFKKTLAVFFNFLPLIWKTAFVFALVCLIELVALIACWYESDNYLIFWFVEKVILSAGIFYAAICLKRLKNGGKAISSGDLNYKIDTDRMIGDFKEHGDNLSSISSAMNHAVNERLKSERMKTELITNVSHDIKTPLTSIISYSDLIIKEECDNPKVTEYAAVLLRQSERLKKLIEDLVEASKASTGNLEVVLSPCEVGVLLTQVVGEYEQRLTNASLHLVVHCPQEPVTIYADGRRLWRVFDNLLNNICKYAQGGTRVYLTLEEKDNRAVISFKNTSSYQLEFPAEELMERFVRGDKSRGSEGNGLGLSIAKSLTELQDGSLDVSVDGDLFKVVLSFPVRR